MADKTTSDENVRLKAGMILLRVKPPTVYTAVSARTLVAYHDDSDIVERVSLTSSGVPVGFKLVKNGALGRRLALELLQNYREADGGD